MVATELRTFADPPDAASSRLAYEPRNGCSERWLCLAVRNMASDGDVVQTWAVPSAAGGVQSVRYLTGLSVPEAVSVEEFQRSISEFVRMVLSRLRSVGCTGTDLEGLGTSFQKTTLTKTPQR